MTMEKDSKDRIDAGSDMGGSFAASVDEAKRGTAAPDTMRTDVIDTNAEEAYWRQNFSTRSYVPDGTPFIEYKPAYRYGADAFSRHPGRTFEHVQSELQQEWDGFKGTSSLTWEHAKHAARDAWQRVSDFIERATPGDSDRDGK
jgi:hypothetical protein